jgi:hypothetical protein
VKSAQDLRLENKGQVYFGRRFVVRRFRKLQGGPWCTLFERPKMKIRQLFAIGPIYSLTAMKNLSIFKEVLAFYREL